MSWWLLLCALAVTILANAATTEQRKIHRLIGGHLRINNEDSELLEALSSGSKNKKTHNQKNDDEEKKTLSQQVADGKYGLIQKELFSKPSKRPGVLSYDNNPEVPKDNIGNLGGLTKNEIWLAENHLLVLKGGTYPPHDDNSATAWPAIDDYKAPRRQVKIPAHPKVPPPFPVQLTDDGPLQILGTNSSRTLNGTFYENAYALPPPEGFEPGPFHPQGPHPADAAAGKAAQPVPHRPSGEYQPGAPFPPFNLNGTLPPFFASLPPGAAVLPPPNQTEIDEDDPSIYYPPPYSFYYPKDNSSAVPAGPLVPGIILPPPPNFFGPLEETTTTTTTKKPRTRVPTTTTPLPQIHPTTTSVPPTSVIDERTTRKPVRVLPAHIPSEINNELKPIVTTGPPKVVTVLPVPARKPPAVTILKPVSETPKVYVYDNDVYNNRPQRIKTVISTTQVPLKVYYSTADDIETNSITQPPEKYHVGVTRATKPTAKSPVRYYYYEEQQPDDGTTRKPYYYVPAKRPPQKFIYVTARPYDAQRPRYRFVQQTPKTNTFSIHIARLQKQIHQYYTTPRPVYRQSPKPVYQFSFEAANYRPPQRPPVDGNPPQDKFRPLPKYSVQIQPAIEIVPTESPKPPEYDYEEPRTRGVSRPISQYSFEATPNPVHQGFYTKPDEGYFDENTKQYFTTFGKKIPGTTPLPPATPPRQRRPNRYQPKPTLEGDTAVNYLPPRPTVNPDAEFVPVNPPQYAQESRQKNRGTAIPAIPTTAEGRPGSFISYQLPGDDGAHFYFLTPQLAQSREQGAGYYYAQPRRVRRNRER